MSHVYVRTYTISFHVFILWCPVLFVEIYSYLHSQRVLFVRNRYFSPMRLISVVMKYAFLTLNCFVPKLAKTLLILIK